MQITIGDIGAIAGYAINPLYTLKANHPSPSVLIYRPSLSADRFRIPHLVAIGYLLFSILAASYLWWWMSKENKRRDGILVAQKEKGEVESRGDWELSAEERQKLGDRTLQHRYVC